MRRFLVAGVVVGSLLCGCSGATEVAGTTSQEVTAPEPTVTTLDSSTTGFDLEEPVCGTPDPSIELPDASLVEMLQYIPNESDYRAGVWFFAGARQAIDQGLVVPNPSCNAAVEDFAKARFTARSVEIEELGAVVVAEADEKAWGFSYLDAGFEVKTVNSYTLKVSRVSVGAAEVDAAVLADGGWSGDLQTIHAKHGSFYQWGDGWSFDFGRKGVARPQGQGATLAVASETENGTTIVQALKPEQTAASLSATVQGTGLDTDPDFAAVSAVLDQSGAHYGLVMDSQTIFDGYHLTADREGDFDETRFQREFPRLGRYSVLGLGWHPRLGADGGRLTIVFAAGASQSAEQIVEVIAARSSFEIPGSVYRWPEVLTLVEDRVEGDVATMVFDSSVDLSVYRLPIDALLAIYGG